MSTPLFPPPGKRVGRPTLPSSDAFLSRIQRALHGGWRSNGSPLVQELEAEVATLCGSEHAVSVCNATVGLELVLAAAATGPEIIMPSFTFAATVQAARWIGLEPILVDVDPVTHLPTREAVRAKLSERTGAILGVHLWGEIAGLDGLGVPTVYDAAHALAWSGAGGLGQFGDASVLSFHATKSSNAFEGGCIVTDDAELADKVRKMANFGNGLPAGMRGTNGKMSEASAAMASATLEGMHPIIDRNRENLAAYRAIFASSDQARILELSADNDCQYVVIELREGALLSMDALIEALAVDNVFLRPCFRPVGHTICGLPDSHFPVSARLSRSVAILPTGLQVTSDECRHIGQRIRQILEG